VILSFIFKSSITTQKYPSGPCPFFQETQQFFEVFEIPRIHDSWNLKFLKYPASTISSILKFFKNLGFRVLGFRQFFDSEFFPIPGRGQYYDNQISVSHWP
jgi:hypothetical protein